MVCDHVGIFKFAVNSCGARKSIMLALYDIMETKYGTSYL